MSNPPKKWIAHLTVKADQLCSGMKLIRKVTGLGRHAVPLRFAEGQLEVEFGDYMFSADAEGEWDGTAMVPAKEMRQWAGRLPQGRSLVPMFVFEEGSLLWTPTMLVRCDWNANNE